MPFNARVAVVTVDDPFGIRDFATDAPAERTSGLRTGNGAAMELRSPGQPKVQVIVSLRDDPLRQLHIRGNITDLQYMAGIRYRDDVDTSAIGGARAIDYSRPAVDGGGIGDPLRDSVSTALDRLARADRTLGHAGKFCCRVVLGEGVSVAEFARRIGRGTKHGQSVATEFFRSCLDILAEVYGLATRRVA